MTGRPGKNVEDDAALTHIGNEIAIGGARASDSQVVAALVPNPESRTSVSRVAGRIGPDEVAGDDDVVGVDVDGLEGLVQDEPSNDGSGAAGIDSQLGLQARYLDLQNRIERRGKSIGANSRARLRVAVDRDLLVDRG